MKIEIKNVRFEQLSGDRQLYGEIFVNDKYITIGFLHKITENFDCTLAFHGLKEKEKKNDS